MSVEIKVASFFSGAGGLDEGFANAGFKTIWANEFDPVIASTFKINHANTEVAVKSIAAVQSNEIPEVDGFIGGPPCQSWSQAGAKRGMDDPRGQFFLDYIRLIDERKPLFFVAENVLGLLAPRNADSLNEILDAFCKSGYNVSYGVLNAADYGVAQDRKRVIFVGYRVDLNQFFRKPTPEQKRVTLGEILSDLPSDKAIPVSSGNAMMQDNPSIPNHHYWDSDHYSSIYMSRNRVRGLNDQSFTIQASASHAPLHPKCAPMKKIGIDQFKFSRETPMPYRRLSVRECARIQGFPDSYVFQYKSINTGYKMIGNAVPIGLAKHIAKQIWDDLHSIENSRGNRNAIGIAKRF